MKILNCSCSHSHLHLRNTLMQENNRNELERFDEERHADFLNMLKGFVLNQVTFFYYLSFFLVYVESGGCHRSLKSLYYHVFVCSPSLSKLYLLI